MSRWFTLVTKKKDDWSSHCDEWVALLVVSHHGRKWERDATELVTDLSRQVVTWERYFLFDKDTRRL